jgi:hypothetical protein
MELLNNLEIYELLQLYIVSEMVKKNELNSVYSALFQNLQPKHIDLNKIKQNYIQMKTDGAEAGFLSPKVILSQLLSKMDDLREKIGEKVENTESMPSGQVVPIPTSPRSESNGSSSDSVIYFEELVEKRNYESYKHNRRKFENEMLDSLKQQNIISRHEQF